MKQRLVPSIDMLTETEPLFPSYPSIPHATEHPQMLETWYFCSRCLFIHVLMKALTFFLLAIILYLLKDGSDMLLWVRRQSIIGVTPWLLMKIDVGSSIVEIHPFSQVHH
ncbi:hypothetical protein CRG98_023535 [Punica granatum]|uniref:Uncharacterized protein n=1 Tax=Punica granatum TaxID=22663 RepID=A0A2I0JKI3_PUNGR|nr:hypothetical protein CRG98_023535 [Punica granatum]